MINIDNLDDIVGQDTVRLVVNNIVSKPSHFSHTLLFHGPYGTGKTTVSRLMADMLNSDAIDKDYLVEYNCAMINADSVVGITNLFKYNHLHRYQVYIFDEVHLLSPIAQSMLLNIIDSLASNTFIIFCTTEFQKVIDTIKSRSIQLKFSTLNSDSSLKYLHKINSINSFKLSDTTLNIINMVAKGHVRDLKKLYDLSFNLDESSRTKYLSSLVETEYFILNLFLTKNLEQFNAILSKLIKKSNIEILHDTQNILLYSIKLFISDIGPEHYATYYQRMVERYNSQLFKLQQFILSGWFERSFTNDVNTQSALWSLYYNFIK